MDFQRKIIYLGNTEVFDKLPASSHPQFKHINYPPEGYVFCEADSLWKEKNLIEYKNAIGINLDEHERLINDILKKRREAFNEEKNSFVNWCVENGVSDKIYQRFITKLDAGEKADSLPLERNAISFLPSYILSLQKSPYVVEIEDVYTLFFPFADNANNTNLDVKNAEFFKLVTYLLCRDECKHIVTHVRSTYDCINNNFANAIAEKTSYIPMGIEKCHPDNYCHSYQKTLGNTIRMLFTSSWHQYGFSVRGGLDVIHAFYMLSRKFKNVELVIKCWLPRDIPKKYLEMVDILRNEGKLHIISNMLTEEQMQCLMKSVDVYLLPSARIHIVSILDSLAHGIPIITSDGWGIEEYIQNGQNGSVVRGRYGNASYVDDNGFLKENYEIMFIGDESYAFSLFQEMERVITDDEYRHRITKNGMNDIETRFSIDNWNSKLKDVMDNCYEGM